MTDDTATRFAEPARLSRIALTGYACFILIGWSALLVPSMIRSVETSFDQTDAGIGAFYLLWAIAYAIGSFSGGLLTERVGRRVVLPVAAALLGLGLVSLAVAPSWSVFMLAAVPSGFGAGGVDGGVNGLFLALYERTRSGALNLLHLFFSLGSLSAPLVIGQILQAGGSWQILILGTGVAALVIACLLAFQPMPSSRHFPAPAETGATDGSADRVSMLPFIALAAAICFYVASEIGVSNWMVRFLGAAPVSVATLSLSLFWGGLTLGRLLSAAVADRFDPVRFTVASTLFASIALLGAVVSPVLPLSIALFAVSGVGFGPAYPMIISIGGTIYPERLAAVSGGLGASAVVGSIVYPPLMGFVSVQVGLGIGMFGTGLLGLACAGALITASTASRDAHRARLDRQARAKAR